MSHSNCTYTFRCGEKVELEKSADQLVIRALPTDLIDTSYISYEQVSSASTKVLTSTAELEALMTSSRAIAPTHHAYFEAQNGAEFLITDRILLTFKEALNDEQVDEFANRYALIKKATYSDRDYLFQLTTLTGMNPVKLVVKLTESEPLVELTEHDLNQRLDTRQFSMPLDPDYIRQWHLHTALNHPDFDHRASSRCEEAWQILDGFGDEDVVVAVADDGCKVDHVDFSSAGKFASWGYFRSERLINAFDIDAQSELMYKAGANHGTACCGVIAGEVDSVLTVGAASNCRLLPIQWESSGSSLFLSASKLLTALNYIADKVDVMSNSWGSSPTSIWPLQVINRITELSQTGGRRGKGIVFLWAAGNENCPINHQGDQDIPWENGIERQAGSLVWVGVKTARIFRHNLTTVPGVMHIAALASTAKRSHYSNYGTDITLCAPSSNSYSYFPRASIRGLGITTTTGNIEEVRHDFGGTSSATPLVAGISALIISANPNLSAANVIAILKQTASKDLNFEGYPKAVATDYDPDPSWDVSPVVPFDNGDFLDIGSSDGSWSPWFGHGKVDALAAVSKALSLLETNVTQSFTASASPNAEITDNNPVGIQEIIVCNDSFVLDEITIAIDIRHTYIGDLVLILISPNGTSVVLQERAGGRADNINVTYDRELVPALHTLSGESVMGDWILHIKDLAPADQGRLLQWSLNISGHLNSSITAEESPGIAIPDNEILGIERSLVINQAGQLERIEVQLDITHTYVGDLTVELNSPTGTTVILHQNTGSSTDNIIRSYSSNDFLALQAFIGSSITGEWRLRVADEVGLDLGKLNHWGVKCFIS